MREEIIKMAREAGLLSVNNYWEPTWITLERFFHMAQAAMVEQGWRKCAEGQRTTQFCGMTEKAVLAEREACAKVCDTYEEWCGPWGQDDNLYAATESAKEIAEAIRARGQA